MSIFEGSLMEVVWTEQVAPRIIVHDRWSLMNITKNVSPLERVAEGHGSAVQECVDEYGPLVWSLTRKMVGNQEDAEDVVQDIFVDVWRSAPRFDPSKASARGFVAMIARRRLVDRIRRQQSRPRLVQFPEGFQMGTDEHERTEAVATAPQILGLLDRLRDDHKQFVQMAVLEGMTHKEISDKTGTPLGTVKSGIRRSLISMREWLAAPVAEGGLQ